MEISESYFVGLTLPQDLRERIDGVRTLMHDRWGNRSGMRTECHITLVPPFHSEKSLFEIRRILSAVRPGEVKVHVSGWGAFGERTIFARVERNRELEALRKEVCLRLGNAGIRVKDKKKFIPHITVANRDIKPEAFAPSIGYVNSIEMDTTFIADSLMIFVFRDYAWRSGEEGKVRFSS